MIRELAWLIEDNRYVSIIEEIEKYLSIYLESLTISDKDKDKARSDLYTVLYNHIMNSGYAFEYDDLNYYIDEVLCKFNRTNTEALEKFEKEIIKSYMYQKNLWQYMGTVSTYSHISKYGLMKSGLSIECILPVQERNRYGRQEPLKTYMEEHENTSALYCYQDGRVCSSFDYEESKLKLNTLFDNSGFDWELEGWDPNYEVDKTYWKSAFNADNIWAILDDNVENQNKELVSFSSQLPHLKIFSVGENYILCDYYNSLIYFYMLYVLSQGSNFENVFKREIDNIKNYVESVMINKKISRVVLYPFNDIDGNISKLSPLFTDKEILEQIYHFFLPQIFEEKIEFIDLSDLFSEMKDNQKTRTDSIKAKNAKLFSKKLYLSLKNGLTGENAIKTALSARLVMPYDYRDSTDCSSFQLSDDDIQLLKSFEIPSEKTDEFNRILFNFLQYKDILISSEFSLSDLINLIYRSVVQDKLVNDQIELMVSLRQLIENPNIFLINDNCPPEDEERINSTFNSYSRNLNSKDREVFKNLLDNLKRVDTIIQSTTNLSIERRINIAVAILKSKSSFSMGLELPGRSYQKSDDGSMINIKVGMKFFALLSKINPLPELKREKDLMRFLDMVPSEYVCNLSLDEELKKYLTLDLLLESAIDEEMIKKYEEKFLESEDMIQPDGDVISVDISDTLNHLYRFNEEINSKLLKKNISTIFAKVNKIPSEQLFNLLIDRIKKIIYFSVNLYDVDKSNPLNENKNWDLMVRRKASMRSKRAAVPDLRSAEQKKSDDLDRQYQEDLAALKRRGIDMTFKKR